MEPAYNDTRIDRVDSHAICRKLQSRAASQLIQCGLADAVCEHSGERTRASHARDVDDVASRALKTGRRELHQVKHRPQVDVHHLIPQFQRGRFDAAALEYSRRVDQDVETAHRVETSSEKGL